ncbi:hypothetical protein V6N13_049552 [Hibiscus sabdariffa]
MRDAFLVIGTMVYECQSPCNSSCYCQSKLPWKFSFTLDVACSLQVQELWLCKSAEASKRSSSLKIALHNFGFNRAGILRKITPPLSSQFIFWIRSVDSYIGLFSAFFRLLTSVIVRGGTSIMHTLMESQYIVLPLLVFDTSDEDISILSKANLISSMVQIRFLLEYYPRYLRYRAWTL